MRKLTYEFVKEYIESFDYKLISTEYNGNKKPIKVQCPHNHEPYNVTFDNFKNKGQRCKQCRLKEASEKLIFDENFVKEYVESFGYKLLSEYKGANEYIKLECPDGHIWETCSFNSFKNNNARCKHCTNKKRNEKTKHNIIFIKNELLKYGYILLTSEYENAHQKLKMICPNGHVINSLTWNRFQQGDRCPKCKESKGEKEITKVLNDLNIDFKSQHKFDDCKFKKQLPFDFYIPQLNIIIEYDGELHYMIKEHRGGFDGFVDRIIRDTIKTEYCKKNNIRLIRIPYWEFKNIEKILKHELKK